MRRFIKFHFDNGYKLVKGPDGVRRLDLNVARHSGATLLVEVKYDAVAHFYSTIEQVLRHGSEFDLDFSFGNHRDEVYKLKDAQLTGARVGTQDDHLWIDLEVEAEGVIVSPPTGGEMELTKERVCPGCGGEGIYRGFMKVEDPCFMCEGTGKVHQ